VGLWLGKFSIWPRHKAAEDGEQYVEAFDSQAYRRPTNEEKCALWNLAHRRQRVDY